MSLIERDVVLTSKQDGQDTLDMPITRLANVEGDADVKDSIGNGDYVALIDSADGNKMKKVSAKNIKGITGIIRTSMGTWEKLPSTYVYPWECEIPLPGLTASDRIQLYVSSGDLQQKAVRDCGLCPVVSSNDGYILIWAKREPYSTISFSYKIEKG